MNECFDVDFDTDFTISTLGKIVNGISTEITRLFNVRTAIHSNPHPIDVGETWCIQLFDNLGEKGELALIKITNEIINLYIPNYDNHRSDEYTSIEYFQICDPQSIKKLYKWLTLVI